MDHQTWDRLIDYFTGELPPKEHAEFQRWILADPARIELVESLRQIWEGAAVVPEPYDPRAALERFRARMEQRGQTGRPQPTAPPLKVMRPLPAATPRRKHLSASARLLRIAAMVLLFLLPPLLWGALNGVFRTESESESVQLKEISAARGQRLRTRLPDGSHVLLAPESRLRYPTDLKGAQRDVHLQGRALFEVMQDPERPFLVHAGPAVTQVLGTRFVVRAYPGAAGVEVAVAEGKVALRAQEDTAGSGVVLEGGQLGELARDGITRVAGSMDLEPYFGWTEGRLVFQKTPVTEVLAELGRWYDVDIQLRNPVLLDQHLTISFRDEPLEQGLELLAVTLEARYERKGKRITLTPLSTVHERQR